MSVPGTILWKATIFFSSLWFGVVWLFLYGRSRLLSSLSAAVPVIGGSSGKLLPKKTEQRYMYKKIFRIPLSGGSGNMILTFYSQFP